MPTYQERGDRIRVIIRRKGHKPASKTFARKTDAVKWARKMESDLDSGGFVEAKDSVDALLERYGKEVSEGKEGWKSELTRIGRLRAQPWAALRASECSDAINEWAFERRKKVKGSTINRELNVLSGVFTYAMKHWRLKIRTNPIKLVARPKKGKPRNRRISADELKKIWDHPFGREHTIRWYIPYMVEFGIETALRLSEMCNLEWADVHEAQRWLAVTESKNGDSRKVPMTARALELLKMIPRETDNVFPVQEGSFGTKFRLAMKEIGIVDLHFHDTRHEAISRLAKVYPILQLAAISGHRDLKSLQVYYNPTIEELVEHLHGGGQPMPRRL